MYMKTKGTGKTPEGSRNARENRCTMSKVGQGRAVPRPAPWSDMSPLRGAQCQYLSGVLEGRPAENPRDAHPVWPTRSNYAIGVQAALGVSYL